MKALLKQIIAQFHEESLPRPLPRAIELPDLPASVKKAIVLIGVRRCGKTWLLYQLIHQLLATGVKKEHIIYINFEDDRLDSMSLAHLQEIFDAYYELYPQYLHDKLYLFFDEIQEVNGWEKFIRRLLDQEPFQIFITGSSAKMLSKEIATSLRGRTLTREIYPFSFVEYLQAKEVKTKIALSAKQQAIQQALCLQYIERGGFPETLNAQPSLHRELLQSYVETVIYRDVIERHKISNILAVKQFIFHCLRNAATPLSINKIYNDFKSQGISVSKDSLYSYLSFFEDAYCLFTVPLFSLSLRSSTHSSKKIYPVDTGIIVTYSIKPDFDKSAQLETVVYIHLRKKYKAVYYYLTRNKKEIDFVAVDDKENIHLYQVCLQLNEGKTLSRELSALQEAMEELTVNHAYIITLDVNQELAINNKSITCQKVREFLLN